MTDLQSGGSRFESRPGLLCTKVYSAFHPPESVNEYQLELRRQRQVWLILLEDETQGVQVKLCYPLTMRAIPECHFMWRHYTNRLPLPLPFTDRVVLILVSHVLSWQMLWAMDQTSPMNFCYLCSPFNTKRPWRDQRLSWHWYKAVAAKLQARDCIRVRTSTAITCHAGAGFASVKLRVQNLAITGPELNEMAITYASTSTKVIY